MGMVALPFYAYLKHTKKPFAKHYPINPHTIGEHIRKKRIESGLLQKDVAIALHTCEDTITGWESNRNIPFISWYPNIIQILGYYPFDHPVDTAAGLIERCRHTLGFSYEKLGKRLGVHGTTLMHWKQIDHISNPDYEQTLLQLLTQSQCLPL